MIIKIKNRYTEEVIYNIYKCEAENIKEAVEKAIKEGADLSGDDLFEVVKLKEKKLEEMTKEELIERVKELEDE